MTDQKVAASILSADFAYLAEQIKLVEPHVELIHIDAMDAHFVPPLSVGPVVVESVRKVTGLPLHCH
ncbi:MAG TPA: ribulose-phosphate 3-epimerase, partial [Actinomycetota bacterium]|nr:ribulose-phosphate 3-epimerase [Actinomycetota bacterium]